MGKKLLNLINDLEYDTKYLQQKQSNGDTWLDADNYRCKVFNLERVTYTADEIVSVTDELEEIANKVTESFKNTFINRDRQATEEQIYFANETAKIVLGKFKENIICIDPAPCGFGKSTIKLELMKYMTKLYEDGLSTTGVIIGGDRLDDLRQLQKDLGEYSKYTYLLEGWNEKVCLDKSIKTVETGMCKKCTFWNCKVKKQMSDQKEKPILLVTNTRLKEHGADFCSTYMKYDKGERKILLIDEKPQMFNTVEINKILLNDIDSAISKAEYQDNEMDEKTQLSKYWKEISELVESKMIPLRGKYKRFIISNSCNIPVCMNNHEFMKLWNKYIKHNFKRELQHIHEVLTKGGFYVCESNTEFISTIGYNNLRDMYKSFDKVVIFDGSALYDPEYLGLYDYDKESDIDNSDIRFLYIPNTRTYENLNITINTAHKLTKTEFKNKKYLPYAISNYIKNKIKIGFHGRSYVVTYQEQATILSQLLGNDTLKRQIPRANNKCYYYGNTKGSNEMDECTRMFNIGWDTLPDYQIAIKYLSCDIKQWEHILELCKDTEKAQFISDIFLKKDRRVDEVGNRTYTGEYNQYCFGLTSIDEFQYLDMVSKFYQEVHRTKLRDYNYDKEIKVYLFQTKPLIYSMLSSLLPKCSIKKHVDKLSEFQKAKDDTRENKCKGYDKFFEWFNSWDGSIIKSKKLKEILEVDNEQFKTLIKNKTINETFSEFDIPKKGYYSMIK